MILFSHPLMLQRSEDSPKPEIVRPSVCQVVECSHQSFEAGPDEGGKLEDGTSSLSEECGVKSGG